MAIGLERKCPPGLTVCPQSTQELRVERNLKAAQRTRVTALLEAKGRRHFPRADDVLCARGAEA
jgi:hypothetical protein